jgi:hypothetical protein
MHHNKLDSKSMSLEVLGGCDVTMREGLQVTRCGIQDVEGPTTPTLISRLIYKTTNVPDQTDRCSFEFFTLLGNLSADCN